MSGPWICPRCGTVYAPWVYCCSCSPISSDSVKPPMVPTDVEKMKETYPHLFEPSNPKAPEEKKP